MVNGVAELGSICLKFSAIFLGKRCTFTTSSLIGAKLINNRSALAAINR
jgi:hypothetical protein